jgi:hypothetical protein
LCGISEFEENEKKCVCLLYNCLQFFTHTHTTYKTSHRNHTIIPLSNQHTIIILNSHNLRNICSCFLNELLFSTTSSISRCYYLLLVFSFSASFCFIRSISAFFPNSSRNFFFFNSSSTTSSLSLSSAPLFAFL